MTVVVILPMRENIEKYEGNQMLRLYLQIENFPYLTNKKYRDVCNSLCHTDRCQIVIDPDQHKN